MRVAVCFSVCFCVFVSICVRVCVREREFVCVHIYVLVCLLNTYVSHSSVMNYESTSLDRIKIKRYKTKFTFSISSRNKCSVDGASQR